MSCQVYYVHPSLRKFVRYFWSADVNQHEDITRSIKLFADKYPRMIFQDLRGYKPMKGLMGERLPDMFLSGITTKCTELMVSSTYSHTGISFHTHALKYLFGVDACELTDTAPDLANFILPELSEQLYTAQSHVERINLLSAYLIGRVEKCKQDDCMTTALIQATSKVGETSMKQLLTIYHRSGRQLERKFRSEIGITPKMLMRINRFERSVEMLNRQSTSSLSSIAYSLDYFDQAHFIKEFKIFSGVTPSSFISEKKKIDESCKPQFK